MKYRVDSPFLTKHVVSEIYQAGVLHIVLASDIEIDISDVKVIDSAGVSLLYAWMRYAKTRGVSCRFKINSVIEKAMANSRLVLPV